MSRATTMAEKPGPHARGVKTYSYNWFPRYHGEGVCHADQRGKRTFHKVRKGAKVAKRRAPLVSAVAPSWRAFTGHLPGGTRTPRRFSKRY